MGSLDAYKDEILAQLLEGEWRNLFPRKMYQNINAWFKRHAEAKVVAVRFTFYQPQQNNERYAIYLACIPQMKDGKVRVKDLIFASDSYPLSLPTVLYEVPLYCMPRDLLQKILRKKRKPS
jgi:hypothetical protein